MITKCQAVRDLYFKVKKQNPNLTIKQVVEIMMGLPAPKFFCTYENALRIVSILHRGGDPKVKNPYKLAMYKDLYAKWLEKHGAGVPKKKFIVFKDTLPGVIQSEAPSFYISKDTMVGFISRHDKRGGERCY
jgi:hypothetical protein